MTRFEINAHKSFRVSLPRTVCESVRLNVENMAPFVNIFDISFPCAVFGIDIVERRLSLYDGSAVFPIAHD